MEQLWKYTFGSAELWLAGIWQTVWLVALALAIGLAIAVPLGIWLAARIHWAWKLPALAFSYVFRGTPMLVQLYTFYFGIGLIIGRIPGVRDLSIWPLLRQAWPWVLLTLVLNTAAYTSEIVRGAIETTPRGEIEAARAMGMGRGLILRRIILPGAARRALPAYGNEIIFMLHGSAIVTMATLMDITGVARKIYADTYDPFIPFVTAGLIYLAITAVLVTTFRRLERRWTRHL
ncbi:MAG: ABC transporter permease subunit [Cardiobacteriaceae bacterium]|nr:ABC transporter permease subunit [Cardiobacteriaceae bacterium]